jgi:NDP-sugar pyrophosphorylase family protein
VLYVVYALIVDLYSVQSLVENNNNNATTKALLPIANRPIIANVLQWLEDAGIVDVLVVARSNAATQLQHYLTKVYESQCSTSRIEVVATQEFGTADVLRSLKDRIRVL